MLIVDNFRGKNLDLSECQGTRVDGDNPLDTSSPLFVLTPNPTFYHRYGCYICEMTTFFPLTTPTGPVFYYIQNLAKRVESSTRRGETNVMSVMIVLYYFNEGTDMT